MSSRSRSGTPRSKAGRKAAKAKSAKSAKSDKPEGNIDPSEVGAIVEELRESFEAGTNKSYEARVRNLEGLR